MGKKYYKKKIIEKYNELTAEDVTELLKNMDAVIDKSFKKYKNIPQDELKQRKKHMKRVTLIALRLVEPKKTEIKESDIKNLLIAAYLHDIKKYDKEHQKSGAKYIKKNMQYILEEINSDKKRKKQICKYIKKHSKSSSDGDIVLQILQDADRLEKMCRRYKWLNELLLG